MVAPPRPLPKPPAGTGRAYGGPVGMGMGIQQGRGTCPVCGSFAVEVRLPPGATALVDPAVLVAMHQRTDLHLYLRALRVVLWEATHYRQSAA